MTESVVWSIRVQRQGHVTFCISSSEGRDKTECFLAGREWEGGRHAPTLSVVGNGRHGGDSGNLSRTLCHNCDSHIEE